MWIFFITLKNENEIKTFVLLNTDSSRHAFINKKFAQKICEKLFLLFQKLIKIKFIRKYDEKTDFAITYVIYFIIILNEHRKNLTSLLITKLEITNWFWKNREEKTRIYTEHDQWFFYFLIWLLRSSRCLTLK